MRLRLLLASAALAASMAVSAAPAHASQMIAQNAKYVSLRVGKLGGTQVALVTYYAQGSVHHVLLWGAINGSANPRTGAETKFHVNYSGGYGTTWGGNAWKTLRNERNLCSTTSVPASQRVPVKVVECEIPATGQYWALQQWRRLMPNMGGYPRSPVALELHASHWNTALPVLWLKWDWAAGSGGVRYDHLYGVMSYEGKPVYGTQNTSTGDPTDSYGRNIYVDIHNRHWHGDSEGDHWYRFNSFLTHQNVGDFCATVYPHNAGLSTITQDQQVGQAEGYRATAMGPGVTPIIRWSGPPPGYYSASNGLSSDPWQVTQTPADTGTPNYPISDISVWGGLVREQVLIARHSSVDKCQQVLVTSAVRQAAGL
jgi:hypothetical protein